MRGGTQDGKSHAGKDAMPFELTMLIVLTSVPLLQMLGAIDVPFETQIGTVIWCAWVGTGSVMPWRYARRGDHPIWAATIAVIATAILLWTSGLVLHEWVRQHAVP
jgi:hypothetical protein